MMNCTPRHETISAQPQRRHMGLRAWLGSYVVAMVMALLWAQPVAAQAVGPVYALPGTLTHATGRGYDTILTIANGNQYGLVGQTPEVEAQIVTARSQGEDYAVKVWGDRYAAVIEGDLELIVVSSIQPVEPVAPTATPTTAPTAAPTVAPTAAPTVAPTATSVPTPAVPIAVVTAATVNVRNGPGTDYTRVGSVVAGQTCAIIGRNQAATWWQLSCPGAVSGWVFGELVALAGPVSTVPVVQTAPPPTPVPAATFANWKSSFFANPDLAGTPVLVTDQPNISFNWGTGSPGPNVPNDNFSARFERTLDFAYGTYELSVTMDDGARVFVDDQLIINDWNRASTRTRTAQLVLSGPKRLRVEYFEIGTNAQIQFAINLVSSSEVWQASYYLGKGFGGTQVLRRGEARGNSAPLDYNWGRGAPAPGIPVDLFSARWEGTFNFEGGDYRFKAITDDGIRVYLDGILILDRWLNGYHTVENTFRALGPGNHRIVVEYYEDYGDALVKVWWERISSGGNTDNSGRPRDE